MLLNPTWFPAAYLCVAAGRTWRRRPNDIVGPALLGGLVLIVMLIGFTEMLARLRRRGATTAIVSDVERRALR